jgi:dTMP kinase
MPSHHISKALILGLRTLKRGFFIAFEGIDGSGKSSQARLLHKGLTGRGFHAVLLKEPTEESEFGKKLRSLGPGERPEPEEELRLFTRDREFDAEKNILPSLNAGKVVIIDRYIASSLSYQGALGIPLERVLSQNMGFPWPDLVIVLEIDPDLSESRIRERRERRGESKKAEEGAGLGSRESLGLKGDDKEGGGEGEGEGEGKGEGKGNGEGNGDPSGSSFEIFEDKAYLIKVKEILDSLELPSLIRIKGDLTEEEIEGRILRLVLEAMAEKRRRAGEKGEEIA